MKDPTRSSSARDPPGVERSSYRDRANQRRAHPADPGAAGSLRSGAVAGPSVAPRAENGARRARSAKAGRTPRTIQPAANRVRGSTYGFAGGNRQCPAWIRGAPRRGYRHVSSSCSPFPCRPPPRMSSRRCRQPPRSLRCERPRHPAPRRRTDGGHRSRADPPGRRHRRWGRTRRRPNRSSHLSGTRRWPCRLRPRARRTDSDNPGRRRLRGRPRWRRGR